jgi:lipid-binding SYLF domain-containing protein
MRFRKFFHWLLLIPAAVAFHIAPVLAAEQQTAKVKEAREVMEEIMAIPEQSMPPSLLTDAHAIAIIPDVIKAGFIVGGRFGKGVVMVRGKAGWSDPVFLTLAGGSFGWQIGAQAADVILVFKNRRGLDSLVNGKFTLGADAAVSAGPVGRNAAAATDLQLKSEIYSYSRSRGLFAGVALDGSVLEIDKEANSGYYGRDGITATDIFDGKVPRNPEEAQKLKSTLGKYAHK